MKIAIVSIEIQPREEGAQEWPIDGGPPEVALRHCGRQALPQDLASYDMADLSIPSP